MIGSHHAFISGGMHVGHIALIPTAVMRYLLSKSGTILEDITSRPYRRLDRGLRNTFERHEPPLIFAGGHDHSLQVIAGIESDDETEHAQCMTEGVAAFRTVYSQRVR